MASMPSRADRTWHHCKAFGLKIRSRIPVPEFVADDGTGEADVEIDYGDVPAELENPSRVGVRFQAAEGVLLLRIEGVARYLVTAGRRILVQPEESADETDVRVFLRGAAFSALMHQRHDLVLHGSAIQVNGGCAAFLGESGAGKSTLALAFARRGYPILTDDLAVVRAGRDGRLEMQPGYPQAKLWLDSLATLDLSAENLRRVRESVEKRTLPLETSFCHGALPVARIYRLRAVDADEITIRPVGGARRMAILRNHTYRFRYLHGSGSPVEHFHTVRQLAQQTPIAIVTRPRTPFRLDELVERIEADLRTPAGAAS